MSEQKPTNKFLKGIKRIFSAYAKNIFDGKITSLVGAILIGVGLARAFKGTDYLEVGEWVGAGLVLMGLPDPRKSSGT